MSSPSPGNPKSPKPNDKQPQQGDRQDESPQRLPATGPWLILLIAMIALAYVMYFNAPSNKGNKVEYGFFYLQLKEDNVAEVEFFGDIITGKWRQIPKHPKEPDIKLDAEFNTVMLPVGDDDLWTLIKENQVDSRGNTTELGKGTQVFVWLIIPILMIGFFWFMMRRSADPMGQGMLGNFSRSPAKRFQATGQETTFADVAAMEQAKTELQEVVEFLKTPERFQKLGAEIPKGVLLVGPPGTGKTLLARATAGEAGVPFYSITGSEFIQMFVGVGASRVRDLFRTAKENSPCIIFIDEIDAVGRMRGAGLGGGHDEREQTLNQILSEMDGFQKNEAVIVLAATNRPDVLDTALLRPGRFDRHITIDRPPRSGRVAILKVHCRKVPLSDDVDLEQVASESIGFSGADLKNLVNEAALIATRKSKSVVESEDFEQARDKILMGTKRDEVLNEHEKEMTAYHESGHALLAWLLPDADEVHKVSIIPHGRALGVTQLMPDEDRYNIGEKRLHSQLVFIMGGRSAEKLVFDEYSAGAEDDLNKATNIARKMVAHWGMSEVVGPVAFRQGEEHPFLGKEIHEHREFSEETAHVIDQEVQRFLNEAAERAMEMLTENRDRLDRLAQALLERENIGNDELVELLGDRVHADVDS